MAVSLSLNQGANAELSAPLLLKLELKEAAWKGRSPDAVAAHVTSQMWHPAIPVSTHTDHSCLSAASFRVSPGQADGVSARSTPAQRNHP